MCFQEYSLSKKMALLTKSVIILLDKNNDNNNKIVLQPLYRLTGVSWHPLLKIGGFCWRNFTAYMLLLMTTSAFELGRK